MGLWRPIVAGALTLALSVLCFANAVVRAKAGTDPAMVGNLWPSHPFSLRAVAMAEVGQAAAQQLSPSAATMDRLQRLAKNAPLAPDPFLVKAAMAEKSGRDAVAERLLLEARRRAPRSAAARYLLADLYMRNGNIRDGLREMAILGRLLEGGTAQLVPSLVSYARTPGALPQLKQLLRESPELEPDLLTALAADPNNADLILALAANTGPAAGPQPRWRATLLAALLTAGRYGEAYDTWARFAGVGAKPSGLVRPDFFPMDAPPPFNWSYPQSGGGVAEPIKGGGLHIVYFGRQDVVLATQTMLLPSGRYQLAMRISGDLETSSQLRWSVSCLTGRKPLLELPLVPGKGGSVRGQFEVPAQGCGAQQLELRGIGEELPKSSEVNIGPLQLTKVGSQ